MVHLFNQPKLTTMKKKWFFAGAVLLMAAAAVTVHLIRERSVSFDLLSANVEALTQNEVQEILPCYKQSYSPGTHSWLIECYYETTYEDVFPCSTLYTYMTPGDKMKCWRESEIINF